MIGLPAALRISRPAADERGRWAVIDIGSNSLRLVIWGGPPRTPQVLLNEKIAANLGRNLSKDGLLPEKAMATALRGLARFAMLARLSGVTEPRVVATAAVRDADNGAAFLDRVRALGLAPELLTGAQEAEASAFGVLSAFPDAAGVVGDLGGGSLELVRVGRGAVGDGDTFPWGTLRLPALRKRGAAVFEGAVRTALEEGGWAGAGGTFHLVGGSWRALTLVAMHEAAFPLVDPHGYVMTPERAAGLSTALAASELKRLQEVPRLSTARIASLSDAAALLEAIVRCLRPKALVTSAFGLREGLLYAQMDDATRALDPLLVDVRAHAARDGHSAAEGEALDSWIAALFGDETAGDARLRLAACLLATRVEASGREARAQRSVELALHERWIGITAAERAMVAAALLTEAGEKALPHQLGLLCDEDRLARGVRWGQAIRFARKLGGGVPEVLRRSRLRIEDGTLILVIEPALAALYGDAAEAHHRLVAAQHGLEARLDDGGGGRVAKRP